MRYATAARALLVGDDPPALIDVAHTAGRRRAHHDERLAIVAADAAEAVAALDAHRSETPYPGLSTGRRPVGGAPRVAFVFTGQGGQWPGMARDLLGREPAFRRALDRCDAAFKPLAGWSIRHELTADGPADRLDRGGAAGPLRLADRAGDALSVLGRRAGRGRRPQPRRDCRGLRRRGDRRRGGDADRLPPGSADEGRRGPRQDRGARARRRRGPEADRAVRRPGRDRRDQRARRDHHRRRPRRRARGRRPGRGRRRVRPAPGGRLRLPQPADGAGPPRPGAGARLPPARPGRLGVRLDGRRRGDRGPRSRRRPTGAGTSARRSGSPRRSRRPSRRAADAFVELGPHPALVGSIQRIVRRRRPAAVALATLRRGGEGRATLLEALGGLYAAGVSVDWAAVNPAGRHVRLPSYPWQRERFWPAIDAGSAAEPASTLDLVPTAEGNGHPAPHYAGNGDGNGHAEPAAGNGTPVDRPAESGEGRGRLAVAAARGAPRLADRLPPRADRRGDRAGAGPDRPRPAAARDRPRLADGDRGQVGDRGRARDEPADVDPDRRPEHRHARRPRPRTRLRPGRPPDPNPSPSRPRRRGPPPSRSRRPRSPTRWRRSTRSRPRSGGSG